MNNFWNWLSTSSANPENTALTAKGLITSVLPLLGFVIHSPNFSSLPDDAYAVVVGALTAYSAVAVVVGLVRKVIIGFSQPKV